MTIEAPSRANAKATARPIPLSPPVFKIQNSSFFFLLDGLSGSYTCNNSHLALKFTRAFV
jgi:hypothetical protein